MDAGKQKTEERWVENVRGRDSVMQEILQSKPAGRLALVSRMRAV